MKVVTKNYVVQKDFSKFSPGAHESSTKNHNLQLTNLIKLYFDFLYCLGACPVRFTKNHGTACFCATNWLPQKIYCGLANTLGILALVSGLREQIPRKSALLKANPKPYFDCLYAICFFMYKLVSMKRLWYDWDKYLRLLNAIAWERNLPDLKGEKVLKLLMKPHFIILFYGLILCEVTACISGGFTFVIPISKWTPEWYVRRLVGQSRFIFFFQDSPSPPNVAPKLEDVTLLEWGMAVLSIIGEIRRSILALYADICILAAALTLWVPAKSFAIDIGSRLLKIEELHDELTKEDGNYHQHQNPQIFNKIKFQNIAAQIVKDGRNDQHQWPSIYRSYQAIRQMSVHINTALGNQVTWYLAEGLMYYSSQLNTILFTDDLLQIAVTVIFYGVTICILFTTADANHQMESIKTWLLTNDNFKSVPFDEAQTVLHGVQDGDIGIRGSDIFTITYQLLGGMFSMVVTFFIICVQFGGGDAGTWKSITVKFGRVTNYDSD